MYLHRALIRYKEEALIKQSQGLINAEEKAIKQGYWMTIGL